MYKRLALLTILSLPFTFKVNSFELPDKLPAGELSANVAYSSNYIWRGEEQSGGINISGGFDYGINLVPDYLDFYLGTWAGSMDTENDATNPGHGLELDYYGGFSGSVPMLEDYLSYDAGLLYYDYPGASNVGNKGLEFLEYYASVSYALPILDASISYYYGYSPTGWSQNYGYQYHNISGEVPVPSTPFTLYGGIGRSLDDSEEADGVLAGVKTGYTDYLAGISTSVFGLDVALQYTTTSGYCLGTADDLCAGGQHVVGIISAGF
jgi:uncharacterized protein (TIGR02001 family)